MTQAVYEDLGGVALLVLCAFMIWNWARTQAYWDDESDLYSFLGWIFGALGLLLLFGTP